MSRTRLFKPVAVHLAASEEVFHGYSDDDMWNGYVCPYFPYDEAVRILEAFENTWSYDEERKSFSVRNASDPKDYEAEEFEVIRVDIGGESIELYAIGAYSWAWERYDQP